MSDALKRIEEKYNGNEHVLSPRSDAVKLARALEWLLHLAHGVGKAGGPPESGEIEAAAELAERTLEEVAGE